MQVVYDFVMKKLLPLLLVMGMGVAAAPSGAVFLIGFPSNEPGDSTDFEVLGGFQNQKWQSSKSAEVKDKDVYALWSLAGKTKATAVGETKKSYEEPCPDTYSVKLLPLPKRISWLVATNASWNLHPRAVTRLPNSNATYQKVVKDFLEQAGLKNPVIKISTIIKTDLDNDKQDEIIVAATNVNRVTYFPDSAARAGDYSVLLVRKVIAGKVQTLVLGQEVHLKGTTEADVTAGTQNNPDVWDVVNVLDLNGDGKLEILFFNAIYEDYAVSAVEWNGQKFVERLISGCGA